MLQEIQGGSGGGGIKDYYPIVPLMDANSRVGFVVSGSSNNGESSQYYYAFDGKNTTIWNAGQYKTAWIKVQLPNAVKVKKIFLNPNYNAGMRVKKYTVQGSNDSEFTTKEDLLTEVLENKDYGDGFEREINPKEPYKYYRIYVEGSYHSTGYYISFKEIQFYIEYNL